MRWEGRLPARTRAPAASEPGCGSVRRPARRASRGGARRAASVWDRGSRRRASRGLHGDETLEPRRTLLSELHPGTLAERVAVPSRNLVPKPPALSFEQAACLPTAWLTAYRMLFIRA